MFIDMPENVTMLQMTEILIKIKADHEWGVMNGGKSIKYVDTVFDSRSMTYFRVVFRGFGDIRKTFTTQNRLHDGAEDKCVSLYDEIMDWLDNGDRLEDWDKEQ